MTPTIGSCLYSMEGHSLSMVALSPTNGSASPATLGGEENTLATPPDLRADRAVPPLDLFGLQRTLTPDFYATVTRQACTDRFAREHEDPMRTRILPRAVLHVAMACAVLLLAFAAPASAEDTGIVFNAPRPGTTIQAPTTCTGTSLPVEAVVYYGLIPPNIGVELATQPTLGANGTLASEYTIDGTSLPRGDADPRYFRGTLSGAWRCNPGTYYFQWQSSVGCGVNAKNPCTGPVESLTVTPAPVLPPPPPPPVVTPPPPPPPASVSPPPPAATIAPPSLSIASASSAIRPAIRKLTKHSPTSLRRLGCRRINTTTVTCVADWRDRLSVWEGTWTLRLTGTTTTTAFTGTRAKRSCLERHRIGDCRKAVKLP